MIEYLALAAEHTVEFDIFIQNNACNSLYSTLKLINVINELRVQYILEEEFAIFKPNMSAVAHILLFVILHWNSDFFPALHGIVFS